MFWQAVDNLSSATDLASQAIGHVGLQADIEIAAPRIVVPVDESRDRGFLLLDTGRLYFKGGTAPNDPKASEWTLRLTDIQSKLPLRKAAWEARPDSLSDQLIDPFEVSVALRMDNLPPEETDKADMTVRTHLRPLCGTIDPSRLKALLNVLTNLGLPEDPAGDLGPADMISQSQLRLGEHLVAVHRNVADSGVAVMKQKSQSRPSRVVEPVEPVEVEPQFPNHKKMEVHAIIDRVALTLREDDPPRRSDEGAGAEESKGDAGAEARLAYTVCMEALTVAMVGFEHDMSMDISLAGITLANLSRAEDSPSRYLANSSSDTGQTLILFKMQTFNGEKSPRFSGFQMVLDLAFNRLELKCDAATIAGLKPYYDALTHFNDEEEEHEELMSGTSIVRRNSMSESH
jgi:hypothetical protein